MACFSVSLLSGIYLFPFNVVRVEAGRGDNIQGNLEGFVRCDNDRERAVMTVSAEDNGDKTSGSLKISLPSQELVGQIQALDLRKQDPLFFVIMQGIFPSRPSFFSCANLLGFVVLDGAGLPVGKGFINCNGQPSGEFLDFSAGNSRVQGEFAGSVQCVDGSNHTQPPPNGPPPSSGSCITGTEHKDNLVGTSGNDCIDGKGGNDKIAGLAGNDKLNGNDGNDLLSGGNGNDELTGGKGADKFDCGAGKDKITDFNPSEGDIKSTNCE